MSCNTSHGKLEQKALWARGVYISFEGFTEEGRYAFGRAKRVVAWQASNRINPCEGTLALTGSFLQKCVGLRRTGSFMPRLILSA